MRAADLLAALEPEELDAVADNWGVERRSEDILTAMRGRAALGTLLGVCRSAMMREDVALLCANPFDAVAGDELVDVQAFLDLGFIAPVGDAFAVNLDLAITLAPALNIEFGFAATLLARLEDDELQAVGRAVEIGPRPSRVDLVLDIAEQFVDEQRLMRQVAFLRASDREVIRDALALGELPDDVSAFDPSADAPMVTLDPGETGRRGVVFWFEDPSRDIDARPVVPLELAATLPALLERVPPPPEVVAARAKQKRERRAPTARKPKPDPLLQELGLDTAPAPAAVQHEGPHRGLRVQRAADASAVVDLDSARTALAAQKDEELGPAVLDIVAESLVILRAGVDARDWAERAALKLGL
jgi:hypothetical protein